MTEELFREDATLLACEATVLACDEAGIVLDRTVFYPLGGGQAGDAGTLTAASGAVLPIADTRKHPARPGDIAACAGGRRGPVGAARVRARHTRGGGASTPSAAAPTCASTPPRTCCARWCRTRWTAARSPPATRGWTST